MSHPLGFREADFFALRTALMPFDTLRAWAEDLPSQRCGPEDPGAFDAAVEADQVLLRERLRRAFEDPVLQEAIFLASPDLADALAPWRARPEDPRARRAELALVKYLSRLSGRSTPFGLFAGCSVGRIGSRTRLRTLGRDRAIRHTRPDMDHLCKLAAGILEDPELVPLLTYTPNSSLCEVAQRLHYCEGRQEDSRRAYHLVAVDPTDYLLDTLRRAAPGASFPELAAHLAQDGITLEEAEGYLRELIASQILVPTLGPSISGEEPLAAMGAALGALDHPRARAHASVLEGLAQGLRDLDAEPLGVPRERYEGLAAPLRDLPAKVVMNRLFQTDLVKPAPEAELGGEVLEEIKQAVDCLWRLQPTRTSPLADFVKAFRERYEWQEVPLAQVLDEEAGIGLGTRGAGSPPLLEGLPLRRPGAPPKTEWSPFQRWLAERLMEHERRGEEVLRLDPKDLEPFLGEPAPSRPDAFAVLAQLACPPGDGGAFQVVLESGSGPSGMNLLGRFCHGDPELCRRVKGFLRQEEALRPDAVFAEIVHLPEGRTGNVILRPSLREYEIPYLGRGDAGPERQIPLSDLRISLRGDRVVLRSERLGKEVLPRLTNAHNHRNQPLGIYRFLCLLQSQGLASSALWDWGPLGTLPRLPRVELGRAVLAKARWRCQGSDWAPLLKQAPGPRMRGVRDLQARRGLPRWILLVDGDHKLPVDLHNLLSVNAFLDLVEGRDRFVVEEVFPAPEACGATGPEGAFAHELVIPFLSLGAPAPAAAPAPLPPPRRFAPGGRWLFAKIYTGPAGADRLLRGPLGDLIQEALASGAARRWFFIRYQDPGHHLRLRFEGDPERLWGELLPALHRALEPHGSSGLVSGLLLDTYVPEVARYGGEGGLGACEALFEADSAMVLGMLRAHGGDAFADQRWRILCMGTDRLLQDAGLDLPARLRLMTGIRDGYRREFGIQAEGEHALGRRYRQERADLEALRLHPGERFPEAHALLEARSRAMEGPLATLRALPGLDLEGLLPSLIHMNSNRLLREESRAQEMVIADFLVRSDQSLRARASRRVPGAPPA